MPLRLFLGAAGAAAIALGLLACSDQSNDNSTTDISPTTTAIVSQTRTPSSAVAGVGPPDAYSAYVGELCRAGKQLKDDLAEAAGGASASPQDAFDQVGQAFDRFIEAARKATPPPDLRSWHEAVVDRADAVNNAVTDHDPSALSSAFDMQFPALPASAKATLKDTAQSNPDCQAAGLFQ